MSRPQRPQTLGKIERFWGTLWREFLESAVFADLEEARRRIGHFIDYYNFQRPHRGADGLVPADRFFQAAPTVLRTLKERVAANALELARYGQAKAPFYVTGQVGGQAFSVHAEGERLVLRRQGQEREEIELTSPADSSPGTTCSSAEGLSPTVLAAEPLPVPQCPDGSLLLKTIQARAKERGETTFKDRAKEERRLDTVYDEFRYEGRYTEKNTEEFLSEIMALNSNLSGITWEGLKEKGFERYTDIGMGIASIGNATDMKPDETITANTWHTKDKMPWPTLTRRLQFYFDHEFYLELGEELSVHKDNPSIGGDYPLQMTGGHTRWSIHTSWRDHHTMARLERGGAYCCRRETESAAAARAIDSAETGRTRVKRPRLPAVVRRDAGCALG